MLFSLARGNVRAAGAQSGRFHLEEATIADVHRAIRAKQITATQIVQLYFKRIEAYNGLVVTNVDAIRDVIELSNGDVIGAGQLAGSDITEDTKRRIQIREVIRAHLDKERELFAQGIKVLSLFFIDEVGHENWAKAGMLAVDRDR